MTDASNESVFDFNELWGKLVAAIDGITALPLDDMARWVDQIERKVPAEALAAMAPAGRIIAASQHFKSQIKS